METAWEFNRETGLAANSWLSNHNDAGKDQLVWNQPGGAIGGPIIKDKLFYFGDYEYLASTAYSSLLGTVPVVSTPAGLGGNVNGDSATSRFSCTIPWETRFPATYSQTIQTLQSARWGRR